MGLWSAADPAAIVDKEYMPRAVRRLLVFSSLLVVHETLLAPSVWAACSCPAKADVYSSLASAAVVFIGQVDKVGKNPLKPSESEVRFQVHRKFKGFEEVQMNTIVVYTPATSADCGYSFKTGLDYLVYASGVPAHLKVDSCSRTDVLDTVMQEVQQLNVAIGAASPPPPPPPPKPVEEEEEDDFFRQRKRRTPIITAPTKRR